MLNIQKKKNGILLKLINNLNRIRSLEKIDY